MNDRTKIQKTNRHSNENAKKFASICNLSLLRPLLHTAEHPPFVTTSCQTCKECLWIVEGERFLLPNSKHHEVKQEINCHTLGIIYLFTCICGCFYISKTKRQCRKRIADHNA